MEKKINFKNVLRKGLPIALATSLVFSYGVGDIEAKGKGNGNKNKDSKVEKEDKGSGLKDIDGYWGKMSIEKMTSLGVIKGYTDGTYQPNKPVSQEEAVVLVVRLLGLEDEALELAQKGVKLPFKNKDSVSTWARGYIAVALEMGLIDKDDKFQGKKAATRLDVTALMVKGLGIDVTKYKDTNVDFSDLAHLTAEERLQLAVAVSENLAKGYGDKTFKPNKPVTRGEIAAFLERMLELLDYDDNEAIQDQFKGYFTSFNAKENKITLIRAGKKASDLISVTYVVAKDPIIYYNGKKRSNFDAFRNGDRIEVVLNNEGKVLFISGEMQKNENKDEDKNNDVWEQLKGVTTFNVKVTSGTQQVVYSYDANKPKEIYVLTQKNGKSTLLQGKDAAVAVKAAIDTYFKAGSTFDVKKVSNSLVEIVKSTGDKTSSVNVQYKFKDGHIEFNTQVQDQTNSTSLNWSKNKATLSYSESKNAQGRFVSDLNFKDTETNKEIRYTKDINGSSVTTSGAIKLNGTTLPIQDVSLESTIKDILASYKVKLYGSEPKVEQPKDEFKVLAGVSQFDLTISSGQNSYVYHFNKDKTAETYVLVQKNGESKLQMGKDAAATIKTIIDTYFKADATFDSKAIAKTLGGMVQTSSQKDYTISLTLKDKDRNLTYNVNVKADTEANSYVLTKDKLRVSYSQSKATNGKVNTSFELKDTEAKKEAKYQKEVNGTTTTASGFIKLDTLNLNIENTQMEPTLIQLAKDYKVNVSF